MSNLQKVRAKTSFMLSYANLRKVSYKQSLGFENLLLRYAATWSDGKRLEHIFGIRFKSCVTQPAFGDKIVRSREIDLAAIRTPVANVDDSLMISAH